MADAIDIAVRLCMEFEGLRHAPYICPAGVPSIGYGSTFYEDGKLVTLEDPEITTQRAMLLLRSQLDLVYLPGVLKASPSLTGERLGAIVDFAYNLGVTRYRASTLRKRVDVEDWDGAKEEIVKWTRAGGRILPGLVRRRAAEAAFL